MGDSIELTAAYKRLALARIAYVDETHDNGADRSTVREMLSAEYALRALLAPKPKRDDALQLLRECSAYLDCTYEDHPIQDKIDRAIAALEGSRG